MNEGKSLKGQPTGKLSIFINSFYENLVRQSLSQPRKIRHVLAMYGFDIASFNIDSSGKMT